MRNIFLLPEPKPRTDPHILELLRGFVDRCFSERIIYLEITVRTDKDTADRTISVVGSRVPTGASDAKNTR